MLSRRTQNRVAARSILSVLLVLSALHPPEDARGNSDLRNRFSDEYPEASARLESFYGSLQLSEAHFRITPQGKEKVGEFAYLSDGSRFRTEAISYSKRGLRTAFVTTPERTFRVRKEPERNQFVLKSLEPHPTELDVNSEMELQRLRAKLPFAAYCIFELRVVDFMAEPGFQIQEIVESKDENQPIVRVSFTCRFEDGYESAGEWTFLPESAWVLKEYKYAASLRGRMTYGRVVEGIPIISKAEYWSERADGRHNELLVEAVDVKLEPASADAFTLEAFGIPDVIGQARSRSLNLRMWLVLASVAGLIVAALLAYWARRYA